MQYINHSKALNKVKFPPKDLICIFTPDFWHLLLKHWACLLQAGTPQASVHANYSVTCKHPATTFLHLIFNRFYHGSTATKITRIMTNISNAQSWGKSPECRVHYQMFFFFRLTDLDSKFKE